MDVGGWLTSLGLEQYEATFRENDVNANGLPNLTADDLKDLGITSVGHRRQLLIAIAKKLWLLSGFGVVALLSPPER